jgi:heterogeneous nuclear rnp K-like protein
MSAELQDQTTETPMDEVVGQDNPDGPTDEEYAASQVTLRALVTTKEAGVIIGKQGKNVADLRDQTGVKAGVSKVVPGVHDRVLTVTGSLDAVSKAYGLIAQTLLSNPINSPPDANPITPAANANTSIRLLISHNLMGTIIGRGGLKIKHIQDVSNSRMVASKEMLPQSTERIVEVQGSVESIIAAIWEIGKCCVDDWERGVGTVLYNPAVRLAAPGGAVVVTNGGAGTSSSSSFNSFRRSSNEGRQNYSFRTGNGADFTSPPAADTESVDPSQNRTQNISIPADMVGCIIGRGGAKISEIRAKSGSKISIAKGPHDESGERMFTIVGSPAGNERALYLLYQQLEMEKYRHPQIVLPSKF